jgi:phosphoenolpyruvate carboxykinase (GTP)
MKLELLENEHLKKWVNEIRALCMPQEIHIVTGSDEENEALTKKLLEAKTLIALKRPGSFLARSNPEDVARVEDRTFICSEKEEDAGPTNNWSEPRAMRNKMHTLFSGCMKGRVMYVVPYIMGPIGSPYARVAVEITDSAYVVLNMRLMTRIGLSALEMLGKNDFVKCLHSVGHPLQEGERDVAWPCNTKETHIVHFPETEEVWSYGSGYGGNALLNKKCFALRLASTMARREGWLAEHMLIIGVTNPEGEKKYFAASFPSACGKTNLAMLTPTLPGWKVECVGDDIAWMHWGKDGKLYAINPEAGFFGVAPGTSLKSNPNAMKTIEKNTIFTNVGLTDDGDVWWEGMTNTPPQHLISWTGEEWEPTSSKKAAHPNSRFTVKVGQCPIVDPQFEAPLGVPISGIIFGGRRSHLVPLVREALSWEHGVFLGASMTSETTAAAKGEVGKLRHDPFAMLPFCGYHMGDYFQHWLNQKRQERKMPSIFYVNWFLKDAQGHFMWPGFGENSRVLKWCFERIDGKARAQKTPIGYLPYAEDLGCTQDLVSIDEAGWQKEAWDIEAYFKKFGSKLPQPLQVELESLKDAFSQEKVSL